MVVRGFSMGPKGYEDAIKRLSRLELALANERNSEKRDAIGKKIVGLKAVLENYEGRNMTRVKRKKATVRRR